MTLPALRARLRPAIEVGLSVLAAATLLTLTAGLRAGLTAILGVFVGVYWQDQPRPQRARRLPWVAIGLVLSSLLGVAAAGTQAVGAFALALLAVLASWVSLAFDTGPPGPLMAVIACGVCQYAASAHRGTDTSPWWLCVYVAVGCTVTYAIIVAPLLWADPRAPLARADVRGPWRRQALGRESRLILMRVALAVGLSSLIGLALTLNRVYWITLTVVAVLYRSHDGARTRRRAYERVLGTLMGVLLFYSIAALSPAAMPLLALLALLQFAAELLVARHYSLALVFVTALALSIAFTAGNARPVDLIGARVVDTLLGAAIALAVTWGLDWRDHRRPGAA